MILDKIENFALYKNIGINFTKAFDYIINTNLATTQPGKYSIDGEEVVAIVMEYTTKPIEECKLEAHKQYADVQFIINGEEFVGITTLKNEQPSTPYNPEKDCAFYEMQSSLIKLNAGMFAVFFPDDIHMPGVCIENMPKSVKKVVVKVKL